LDIGTVGFGVDTAGPRQLADSLDQTKQSAQKLNTTLDATSTSSTAAGGRMTALAAHASMGTGTSAANAYNAALGDQVNKLLSLGPANQEIEIVQQKTSSVMRTTSICFFIYCNVERICA